MHRLAPFFLALAVCVGWFLFFGKTYVATVTLTPASPTAAVTPIPPPEEPEPDAPTPPKKAPAGKPWQQIDGCLWKADRWNDGDSFHVVTGDAGREIVARLYFVDTPEAETAYRDRLDEQAAYFGITREQAVQIAHEAAASPCAAAVVSCASLSTMIPTSPWNAVSEPASASDVVMTVSAGSL